MFNALSEMFTGMFAYVGALEGGFRNATIYVLITCCVAIFLTGSLKVSVLNKVQTRRLKKFLCFITGIGMTVVVGGVYRLIDGSAFYNGIFLPYYVASWTLLIPCELVMYQLYENTLLRDVITGIAKKVLGKTIPVLTNSLTTGDKQAVRKVAKETKAEVAQYVKDNVNPDLLNL